MVAIRAIRASRAEGWWLALAAEGSSSLSLAATSGEARSLYDV